MAKKTYKTFHLKGLQILLFDEYGRQIEVTFKAGAQIDSTAKFTTSDEKVQKALESISGFGRDYYLEEVREDNPVDAGKNASEMDGNETETPTVNASKNDSDENASEIDGDETGAVGGVVKVADKSEAIEWLKENYPDKGYTATKLRSKDVFEAACKECGVVFEIAE